MKTMARLCGLFMVGAIALLHANPLDYGGGPLNVIPAWNLPRGQVTVGLHSRAYFNDDVDVTAGDGDVAMTYWDIQGGMAVTYAFTSRFQLGLNQIIYQDNHKGGDGYNLPDDLYFTAKLGSIGRRTGSIRTGIQLDLRFPLAKEHNLLLEPYSAGRIGVGIRGLFSIVSEPLFPEFGINIHANFGFFNHNDLGLHIVENSSDTVSAKQNTQELFLGAAFSTAVDQFILFTELYGRTFLQKPPEPAYGRETSLYFSPGLSYAVNSWLRLRAALDFRLLGSDDETVYKSGETLYSVLPWKNVPNYPSWRITVGATAALRPSIQPMILAKQIEEDMRRARAADPDVIEHLSKERQETEKVEAELERIRLERQRMEELLEKLRTILETPPQPSSPQE
ncbi:MAG TPA: hypothetical protein PKW76_01630 [bacterium]|nr:hypothetical protein [bacterium]HPG44356.1 hypothetical protein [bacterium]HPM96914.1 hypothetical protein [bacterium]